MKPLGTPKRAHTRILEGNTWCVVGDTLHGILGQLAHYPRALQRLSRFLVLQVNFTSPLASNKGQKLRCATS